MADSFLAQKLAAYTDPEHTSDTCRRPFSMTLEGQAWSVAAGRAWVFAVRGTSSHAPLESPLVAKFLGAEPRAALEVDAKKLKEWAGPATMNGSFDEEGQVCGVLFGKVLDLRRLAVLLDPIPFPKLILWDTTEVVGVRSVGISAKGKWRGLLAALYATPEPEMKCFDPRPDGADAFDLMSELTGI